MAGRPERCIRRLVALGGLVALLAASGGPAAAAAAPAAPFSDLAGVPWAASAIANLASRGVLLGVGGGRFDPDGSVTRSALALVLARVEPSQQPLAPPRFSDVPAGSQLAAALRATWSYLGPVLGATTSFHPGADVQRQQVFAAIGRIEWTVSPKALAARADPAPVLDAFTDHASVSPALAPWVAAAVASGIVQGDGSGHLDPTGTLTRAQLAVLVERMSPGANGSGSYVMVTTPY